MDVPAPGARTGCRSASGGNVLGPGDLVLAHGTLRNASFDQRVAASARAGFAGIGLSAGAYARLGADGWSDAALRGVLDQHDMHLAETEGLIGFSSHGRVQSGPLQGRRYADPDTEAQIFAMADAFGVRHVNVSAAFEGQLEPDAAAAFAALCDRAARHDLLVALEPLPCSTVPDITTATRIVVEADRRNGGLCLDSWHFFRGTADEAALSTVPADRVFVVQIDDGPIRPCDPDYLIDTLHHRQLPGTGEFELNRFLTPLSDAGVRSPVSVEVLSDDLDVRPPDESAERAAAATRRVLAQARRATEPPRLA